MRLPSMLGTAYGAANSYDMYYKECSERVRMRELRDIERCLNEALELLQAEISEVKQLEEMDI